MIVVRSSRSIWVRSGDNTSLALNVDVGIKELIHFVVEWLVETHTVVSIPSDVFTGIRACREEAPWSAAKVGLEIGWFPTAALGLA
jgi:hypothetical protein